MSREAIGCNGPPPVVLTPDADRRCRMRHSLRVIVAFAPSRVNRVENRGYNNTKSAFADYAAVVERNGSNRTVVTPRSTI